MTSPGDLHQRITAALGDAAIAHPDGHLLDSDEARAVVADAVRDWPPWDRDRPLFVAAVLAALRHAATGG